MTNNTLATTVERIRSVWAPLSTEVVAGCREQLEELLKAPPTEEWLAALHHDAPANQELYRDPAEGFVLLAHTEPAGLYRPPHDHGQGWVIYAIQQGEIEMGTYARVEPACPFGKAAQIRAGGIFLRGIYPHKGPQARLAGGLQVQRRHGADLFLGGICCQETAHRRPAYVQLSGDLRFADALTE